MKASTKPPITAPLSEPSPPMTLAMNALSTGVEAHRRLDRAAPARMKIAAMPASTPEIANAAMITRLAGDAHQARDGEVLAAASMPSPCIERRRNSVSTTSEAGR